MLHTLDFFWGEPECLRLKRRFHLHATEQGKERSVEKERERERRGRRREKGQTRTVLVWRGERLGHTGCWHKEVKFCASKTPIHTFPKQEEKKQVP